MPETNHARTPRAHTTRALWIPRPDLEAILASPEGKTTIEDVGRFATGGCTFLFADEIVLVPHALTGPGACIAIQCAASCLAAR